MKNFTSIALALVSLNSFAFKEFDENILYECELNKKYANIEGTIDCNDLFHHYKSPSAKKNTNSTKVKIAGYNIYKLGIGETRYKDLALSAKIINQWDVIGVVEPQPALSTDKTDNINIDYLLSTKGIDLTKHFKVPAYIKILQELRKLDPTWSALVSPYGQSRNIELTIFYYRGSKVSVKNTPYCSFVKAKYKKYGVVKKWGSGKAPTKKEAQLSQSLDFACLANFSRDIEKNISRVPFIASFKSNDFDFTMLAVHLRFRPPSEEVIKSMLDDIFHPTGASIPLFTVKKGSKFVKQNSASTLKAIIRKLEKGKSYSNTVSDIPEIEIAEKLGVKLLKERESYLIKSEEIARYFETYQIAKLMEQLKNGQEKDIILVGDFNLELKNPLKGKVDYWKRALGPFSGAQAYINGPTSISDLNGLASNYDHFILNPIETKECDTQSAKSFDFTNPNNFLTYSNDTKLPKWEDVSSYFIDSNNQNQIISDYSKEISNIRLVSKSGKLTSLKDISETYRDCETGEKVKADVHTKWIESYKCRIFFSQTENKRKYVVYKQLISDHLPISMTCSTTNRDDD